MGTNPIAAIGSERLDPIISSSESEPLTQLQRTWIQKLSLTNFRNYEQLSLQLDDKPVVLTGANGAGKTNILEAISLLTPGRGLRGEALTELISQTNRQTPWAVAANLHGRQGESRIGTGINPQNLHTDAQTSATRVLRIDGERASTADLSHYLQITWLTPAMDGLFTGPAGDRRRFLDRFIAAVDPPYRKIVNQFERAMRQRNKLLDLNEHNPLLFESIELQMAETGTAIAASRQQTVGRLANLIQKSTQNQPQSPFPWSELTIQGELEEKLTDNAAIDVEDAYIHILQDNRARDRAAGRTLNGPHRSDLCLVHGPKQMPADRCSTGEQKALLVGLILAHCELIAEANAQYAPLLLLDEITAHLDPMRREALMEKILSLNIQAWMTGTDAAMFTGFGGNAQFVTLDHGQIID